MAGRLGRKRLDKLGDRHIKARFRHVGSHEAASREVAYPADILGAANGFAAKMQAPGCEGIAERLPHDDRNDACDRQHHEAQWKVAGRLEGQETHRHWGADDRHGKRSHADQRADENIRRESRIEISNPEIKDRPIMAPRNKEAKKRPPRKPVPSETTEAVAFSKSVIRTTSDGASARPEKREQAGVAGGQHLRRHQGEEAHDQTAERQLQRERQRDAFAERLDRAYGPHHPDPKQRANDSKQQQKTHITLRKGRVQHHLLHEFAACAENFGNENTADGRGADGRQHEGRIGSQDEFEGVERAGERRAKGRANGTGRTASDKGAQVAAPQPERRPKPGGNTRAQLRIGRLQVRPMRQNRSRPPFARKPARYP